MKSKILYMVFAVYAVIFFGYNAARSFADGHVAIGVALLVGALGGVCLVCHIKDGADREKADKHEKTRPWGR